MLPQSHDIAFFCNIKYYIFQGLVYNVLSKLLGSTTDSFCGCSMFES